MLWKKLKHNKHPQPIGDHPLYITITFEKVKEDDIQSQTIIRGAPLTLKRASRVH